ncbi:MAG: cytochrome P450 [Janthinobacterium lividum]
MSVVPPDIRPSRDSRYPAGPNNLSRVLSGRFLWQSPMDLMASNASDYGDLVHLHTLDGHLYQFNHPALISEIMVEHERHNRRVLTMQRARALLGDGLLTSEEPLHMRQRRMAAPAFHRERIAGYGEVIGRYATEVTGRWQPGAMDVHPQMLQLALQIVGKCMFNIDQESEAKRIAAAVSAFMITPPPNWVPAALIEQLQKIKFGPVKKVQKGIDDLDAILYGLIRERRSAPGDRGDLLSMLIGAIDNEGSGSELDRSMSDKQVRDECLTVLLAGHETTANALSFTLWLLAKHPAVQQQAHQEAVAVLGTRQPAAADYPNLKYLYNVFAESMRMMPTVWVLGRSCGPEPYDFHGYKIEPGATLLAPQVVVHRDPRFWTEPNCFNPDRFAESERAQRPKFAYFPFGGGSRQCIGESFAWMEGVLSLATMLRDWRFTVPAGAADRLPTTVSVNLRPKRGVPLLLERR